MFIFARNWRQRIVTAGVVIACLTLGWLAFRCAHTSGFSWIIALVFLSTAVAVCLGARLGYQVARVIFCVLIVSQGLFAVHPFTYEDFLGDNDAYWAFLLRTELFVAIGCIAFISLGEHAKLRNLR